MTMISFWRCPFNLQSKQAERGKAEAASRLAESERRKPASLPA
jgi:hypothetical protein